jgi:hypothetical protein
MALNRTALRTYADTYWWRPCQDGDVWLSGSPIKIAVEMRRRNLSPSEWTAVFLTPNAGDYIDGLYLLKNTHVPLLAGGSYAATSFPSADCIEVQAWRGLNDCAHFVSECLRAGGIQGIYSVSVANLIGKLRAAANTKTLAYFVNVSTAERIIKSGIMKVGDIVAFGTATKTFAHGHSTVYMGNGKVANHTHLNHPNYTGGGIFGRGVWKPYADPITEHPLVSLIHFDEGDGSVAGSSSLGWWQTTWQGTVYYYYFAGNGRVKYVTTKPSSLKQEPYAPQGKGYWFQTGSELKICWTQTGSYEVYNRTASTDAMNGTCNGIALTLTRMT